MPVGCTEPMAGSHWAGTERCQRRTSVTRRLHRHPPPRCPRRGRAGKGDGRGARGTAGTPTAASPAGGLCPPFSGGGDDGERDSLGIWWGGGGGQGEMPAVRRPQPGAPRPPPPPSILRALHRALLFFCHTFLHHPTHGHLHLPWLHPAREHEIGANRSFHGLSSIPPLCRSPSPPHPARPAAASCQNFWVTARGKRFVLSRGAPIPPPRGLQSPCPATHGSPGPESPARPRKEKDNSHGFLQALAQALRSSARFYKAPSKMC